MRSGCGRISTCRDLCDIRPSASRSVRGCSNAPLRNDRPRAPASSGVVHQQLSCRSSDASAVDAREHTRAFPHSRGAPSGGLHPLIEMFSKNSFARIRLVHVCRSLLTISMAIAPSLLAQSQTASSPTPTAERLRPNSEPEELGELLRLADSANPAIVAARNRVAAAKAKIGPAAAWPDPTLMAGIQNL